MKFQIYICKLEAKENAISICLTHRINSPDQSDLFLVILKDVCWLISSQLIALRHFTHSFSIAKDTLNDCGSFR